MKRAGERFGLWDGRGDRHEAARRIAVDELGGQGERVLEAYERLGGRSKLGLEAWPLSEVCRHHEGEHLLADRANASVYGPVTSDEEPRPDRVVR
jgi:hypothetical protein